MEATVNDVNNPFNSRSYPVPAGCDLIPLWVLIGILAALMPFAIAIGASEKHPGATPFFLTLAVVLPLATVCVKFWLPRLFEPLANLGS
jgi:hypothetical protein